MAEYLIFTNSKDPSRTQRVASVRSLADGLASAKKGRVVYAKTRVKKTKVGGQTEIRREMVLKVGRKRGYSIWTERYDRQATEMAELHLLKEFDRFPEAGVLTDNIHHLFKNGSPVKADELGKRLHALVEEMEPLAGYTQSQAPFPNTLKFKIGKKDLPIRGWAHMQAYLHARSEAINGARTSQDGTRRARPDQTDATPIPSLEDVADFARDFNKAWRTHKELANDHIAIKVKEEVDRFTQARPDLMGTAFSFEGFITEIGEQNQSDDAKTAAAKSYFAALVMRLNERRETWDIENGETFDKARDKVSEWLAGKLDAAAAAAFVCTDRKLLAVELGKMLISASSQHWKEEKDARTLNVSREEIAKRADAWAGDLIQEIEAKLRYRIDDSGDLCEGDEKFEDFVESPESCAKYTKGNKARLVRDASSPEEALRQFRVARAINDAANSGPKRHRTAPAVIAPSMVVCHGDKVALAIPEERGTWGLGSVLVERVKAAKGDARLQEIFEYSKELADCLHRLSAQGGALTELDLENFVVLRQGSIALNDVSNVTDSRWAELRDSQGARRMRPSKLRPAPEQLDANTNPLRVDLEPVTVWQLGVHFCELLGKETGKALFSGDQAAKKTQVTTFAGESFSERAKRVRGLLPDEIPSGFRALVVAMLDPDPSKRPSLAQVHLRLSKLQPEFKAAALTRKRLASAQRATDQGRTLSRTGERQPNAIDAQSTNIVQGNVVLGNLSESDEGGVDGAETDADESASESSESSRDGEARTVGSDLKNLRTPLATDQVMDELSSSWRTDSENSVDGEDRVDGEDGVDGEKVGETKEERPSSIERVSPRDSNAWTVIYTSSGSRENESESEGGVSDSSAEGPPTTRGSRDTSRRLSVDEAATATTAATATDAAPIDESGDTNESSRRAPRSLKPSPPGVHVAEGERPRPFAGADSLKKVPEEFKGNENDWETVYLAVSEAITYLPAVESKGAAPTQIPESMSAEEFARHHIDSVNREQVAAVRAWAAPLSLVSMGTILKAWGFVKSFPFESNRNNAASALIKYLKGRDVASIHTKNLLKGARAFLANYPAFDPGNKAEYASLVPVIAKVFFLASGKDSARMKMPDALLEKLEALQSPEALEKKARTQINGGGESANSNAQSPGLLHGAIPTAQQTIARGSADLIPNDPEEAHSRSVMRTALSDDTQAMSAQDPRGRRSRSTSRPRVTSIFPTELAGDTDIPTQEQVPGLQKLPMLQDPTRPAPPPPAQRQRTTDGTSTTTPPQPSNGDRPNVWASSVQRADTNGERSSRTRKLKKGQPPLIGGKKPTESPPPIPDDLSFSASPTRTPPPPPTDEESSDGPSSTTQNTQNGAIAGKQPQAPLNTAASAPLAGVIDPSGYVPPPTDVPPPPPPRDTPPPPPPPPRDAPPPPPRSANQSAANQQAVSPTTIPASTNLPGTQPETASGSLKTSPSIRFQGKAKPSLGNRVGKGETGGTDGNAAPEGSAKKVQFKEDVKKKT